MSFAALLTRIALFHNVVIEENYVSTQKFIPQNTHKSERIFYSPKSIVSAGFGFGTRARDPVFLVRWVGTALRALVMAILLTFVYALSMPLLPTAALGVFLLIVTHLAVKPIYEKIDEAIESHKLFVSNVAHELRGPMTVMQLDAEAALHNINLAELSDLKSKELIGAINSDLEGLRQMSNILKNLSILTSQQYSSEGFELKKVDLNALLTRLCALAAKEYAYDKSIQIKVESASPVYIMGNESALEQMVMNLLKNAVHYSDAGTGIVATAQQHERGVALSIRDHGFGISERDLPHILDPFYRARHSRADANTQGGTGLGLAIVAALAKQHNAVISIASVLKRGTTVTLNFPLMPVAAL